MSRGKVVIVDYGLGNLHNVERACRRVGVSAALSSDPADLPHAAGLILPGVGAFGDAMRTLERTGLAGALRDSAAAGVPVLGVCLGFQLLFSEGHEFGIVPGLGLLEGVVERLRPVASGGRTAKVPQVGWNRVDQPSAVSWNRTFLASLMPGDSLYFMHSYAVRDVPRERVLAETRYGGQVFCSAAVGDGVGGVQFHPELSGPVGLSVYTLFGEMAGMAMNSRGIDDAYANSGT